MDSYFVFSIAGDRYALPLAGVREVREDAAVTSVPRLPGYVLGVTNLRGRIVAVIDLTVALGVGPRRERAEPAMQVVIEHDEIDIAFIVDELVGVAHAAELDPVFDGLAPEVHRWCRGTLRSADGLALVLDAGFVTALRDQLAARAADATGRAGASQ